MNKQRRKSLGDLIDKIQAARGLLTQFSDHMDYLRIALGEEMQEEQYQHDALSERQQAGEKGQTMQFNLDRLGAAFDQIEILCDALNHFPLDEVCADIDEARGQE